MHHRKRQCSNRNASAATEPVQQPTQCSNRATPHPTRCVNQTTAATEPRLKQTTASLKPLHCMEWGDHSRRWANFARVSDLRARGVQAGSLSTMPGVHTVGVGEGPPVSRQYPHRYTLPYCSPYTLPYTRRKHHRKHRIHTVYPPYTPPRWKPSASFQTALGTRNVYGRPLGGAPANGPVLAPARPGDMERQGHAVSPRYGGAAFSVAAVLLCCCLCCVLLCAPWLLSILV